jgi:hypothetical protein
MSAQKILLALAIIAFVIGALLPVIAPAGSPRNINWLCLGLAFATGAWFVTLH